MAPLLRALNSPRLSMQEQSYLRSTIVDGQQARTLSPQCAPWQRGSQHGAQAPSVSGNARGRCEQHARPVPLCGPVREVVEARVSCTANAMVVGGRPPGYRVPFEIRWRGDRYFVTAVVYEHDPDLCVFGWWLVANGGACLSLRNDALPRVGFRVDRTELFGLFMFLRIARAPAQDVTDSSFVEQVANQRATSGAEIDAWVGWALLSVHKVEVFTTLDAVCAGIITADDGAGNDLADAACMLVVLEHRAQLFIGSARQSAVWPSLAGLTGLRELVREATSGH